MRTLIIVNDSPLLETVFQYSAQITDKSSAGSTIMMVIPRKRRKDIEATKRIINQAEEYPTLSGFQKKIRVGPQVKEILREAQEGNYELIILGAPSPHRRDWFNPKTLLTQIVEGAPCSTLIVRGQASRIKHILVCDSGAESANTLRGLITRLIGLLEGLEGITILHVMSQVSAGPGVPGEQLRADAEYLISSHTPEGDLLEKDIRELSLAGVHPDPMVRHGLVVDEILEEASSGGYDLAIIGAHSQAGWQWFLLDNLARKIVDQIDLSLLVVKHRVTDQLEIESQ